MSNKDNLDPVKELQSALFKGIMENTTLKSQLDDVKTRLKSLEDRLTKIDLIDSRKKTPNRSQKDLNTTEDNEST